MLSEDQSAPRITRRRTLGTFVVLVCLFALIALAIPAIHAAREASRRMQSANNLKQIALAALNYESANRRLPMGADTDAFGPKHGWIYRIEPYIEASPLYSMIERNLAWNHPRNAHLFSISRAVFLRPGIKWKVTGEGYDLTHYLGCPAVFPTDHALTLAESAGSRGTSNTWCIAECFSEWQPRGYPYNCRELNKMAHKVPSHYVGIQVAMVDGSVRFVDTSTGYDAIDLLTLEPNPRALPPQPRSYAYSDVPLREVVLFEQDLVRMKGSNWNSLQFDRDDVESTLDFAVQIYKGSWQLRADLLAEHARQYPRIRNLILRGELTDEVTAAIANLSQLEFLSCEGSQLSSKGYDLFNQLPALREVYGLSEGDLERVRAVRPELRLLGIISLDQR